MVRYCPSETMSSDCLSYDKKIAHETSICRPLLNSVVSCVFWLEWAGGHFIFWAEKFWTTPSQKSSAMSSQTLVKVVDLGWGIGLAVR